MPAVSCSAPGKVILFGEHAVVYNRPAIAIPVTQVRTKVNILPMPGEVSGKIIIHANAIGLTASLDELAENHPIAVAIHSVMDSLKINSIPSCQMIITSTIPVAAGLGSGAAVTVAICRALSAFIGNPLPNETINQIAYQVEKIHHGTPSGIDNTVITYEKPLFFHQGASLELMSVAEPFCLVIADTGEKSSTKEMVGGVRFRWSMDPEYYNNIFDDIHRIVLDARQFIENGPVKKLGALMNANHHFLRAMRVSTEKLEKLIEAAIENGALGAKLSGSGGGGNMIALVENESAEAVAEALQANGAVRTIITKINPTEE